MIFISLLFIAEDQCYKFKISLKGRALRFQSDLAGVYEQSGIANDKRSWKTPWNIKPANAIWFDKSK